MPKTSPPRSNEPELSLFGPGVGECAVVHLGAGNWMVVDSCLDSEGNAPVALSYLRGLGVDVATQVKLVVVTHWHDDHIRGAAWLLRHAEQAKFACSGALDCEAFRRLISADSDIKLVSQTSGVSEFAEILEILDARSGARYRAGPDLWACSETRLYYDEDPELVQVYALSPSPQVITDSKGSIAALIPSAGQQTRRAFHSTEPNDTAVTLLIQTPNVHFLLGADLPTGGDPKRGWRAVLDSNAPRRKILCGAYKVSHHGSENGDLDGIWTDLLIDNPRALVTPFAKGPKRLPSDDDVRRLKKRTKYLYCTAWPPSKSPRTRNPAVDRTMREIDRSRREIRRRPGHIRLRAPITGNPRDMHVKLFDGAKQL